MPRPDATLELIVLCVLAEAPAYGYAISRTVQARADGAVACGPGVLYPLLKRMERQGLIAATWQTVKSDRSPDSPGRRRKWYRLTPRGRRRLEQSIHEHKVRVALLESFFPASLRNPA